MREIGIVLNILINFVPGSFLRIWPNIDRLRVRKTTFMGIYLLFFTAQSTIFVWMQGQTVMDYRAIQLFKLAFGVVALLLPFVLLTENLFKTLFFYFITALYQTVVVRVANHIDVRYWGSNLEDTSFWSNTLTLSALSALTIPLMALFIKRIIRPIMDCKFYPNVWRFFWLAPAALYGVLIADSIGRGFSLAYMGSNWFLFINLFIIGGMCAVYFIMANILKQAAENATLKENARMTESLLALQREQFERMTQSAEAVKSMRHDLRHHLAVIAGFAEAGSMDQIIGYIENLEGGLTVAQDRLYCKNHAVNAITSLYLGLAESEGAAVEARLDVPEDTGLVPSMDLCVILGNYLENAVEACRRMQRGDRFIRVRSRIAQDTLSIVVTNSFDGLWREQNGTYLSRKTVEGASSREGVGLASVWAVCEKHRGLVQYEITELVWKSSALVHMGD